MSEVEVAGVPVETADGLFEIKRAKKLRGGPALPGDAHQAMLACAVAALGEEPSRIENLPEAPWFAEYRAALEALGAVFEATEDGHMLVRGGALKTPEEPLQIRHELAALILSGLCAGRGLDAVLQLDPLLVPGDVTALLKALYPQEAETPEGTIRPRALNPKARGLCKPYERKWDEGAAKVALLFHHLAAGESLELHVRRQGSDLLENLLRHFEIDLRVERDDDKDADELTRRIARQMRAAGGEAPTTRIRLPAGAKPKPAFLALAGDVTEASIIALAATLVKGSDVQLDNVLLNTGRGGFLAALRRMGADIEVVQRREPRQGGGEARGTLRVRSSEILAKRFDADTLADMRDEVFLLLAAAAYAEGETVFRNLDWLRLGTDRLREFTAALKRTGVETGEIEDGIVIRGRAESDGGAYDSLGHPGLAAACAVIALRSHGTSTLAGADALEARHPGLLARIEALSTAAVPSPAEKTP
jgi:3-phosphoshikimate 1-carboxyvinyltransferase